MSDLFPDLPEQLSPAEQRRRKFLRDYGATTIETPEEETNRWHCYRGTWSPTMLAHVKNTRWHSRAQTEAAAIETLAQTLGVDLSGAAQREPEPAPDNWEPEEEFYRRGAENNGRHA